MAYRLGYEEDSFLKSLSPFEPHEIELKADNCTKVNIVFESTYLGGFMEGLIS